MAGLEARGAPGRVGVQGSLIGRQGKPSSPVAAQVHPALLQQFPLFALEQGTVRGGAQPPDHHAGALDLARGQAGHAEFVAERLHQDHVEGLVDGLKELEGGHILEAGVPDGGKLGGQPAQAAGAPQLGQQGRDQGLDASGQQGRLRPLAIQAESPQDVVVMAVSIRGGVHGGVHDSVHGVAVQAGRGLAYHTLPAPGV
ncbi:hypothetical protein RY27_16570 [Litorilinea aerophila]|nr:hypothetical protein RY27_16570 [Litorilinea aerophila]